MDLLYFIPGYTQAIFESDREPAFFMMVSFLVTFILARGYTRIARIRGWGSASFGGVHTHHLVFGLVMAFIAGAIEFAFLPEPGLLQLFLAVMFGAGVALVLDEFALLFHLEDVYWEKEGRKSVDAVVVGALLGLLFLLHTTPTALQSSTDVTLAVLTIAQVINLIFVIISAAKGKVFFAAFGVLIPALALIGALRLAEPGSLWAHKFYKAGGKKHSRSIERYRIYEANLVPIKQKLWDMIGGAEGRPVKK